MLHGMADRRLRLSGAHGPWPGGKRQLETSGRVGGSELLAMQSVDLFSGMRGTETGWTELWLRYYKMGRRGSWRSSEGGEASERG